MLQTLALIAAFFTSPAYAKDIKIAHGAGADKFVRMATKELATGPTKVKVLREGGLTADTMLMLVDSGEADLGISPNSLDTLKETAIEKKLSLKNLSKIKSKDIGSLSTVIITSNGLPTQLSKDQVKKLFTGEVANWKELGGPDVPVEYIILTNMRVTTSLISKQWLDGAAFRFRQPKEVPSAEEAVKLVKASKGGVSFVVSTTNLSGVQTYASPTLERTVSAIYLEEQPGFEGIFKVFAKTLNEAKSGK